ncbi:uncharacterized protein Dwil_GK26848 [Drosophila willistoni]|uniref:golgin subfamily A member 6-like protein 6 n=1 Tax=Drosophila willistoni TaxID=7260 RepID=UPI0007327F7A|nr:golgin subfamily A member 6-like protein 6 [Drosophila willistoni]KRF97885.1 uncharacterized protein Dwil_GK26848 [Drosophila willistoni]
MRPKKSNLGRRTRNAEKVRRNRSNRTDEERELVRETERLRQRQRILMETAERRAVRLERQRLRARKSRSAAIQLLRSQRSELQPEQNFKKKKPIKGYKCSQCPYESVWYHNAMRHLQAIHRGEGSLIKFDKTEAPLQPDQNEKQELNNGLEANSREVFQPNSELHTAVWEEQIEFKQEPAWQNTPEFEERLNLSTGLEEEFVWEQREEPELHREPEWEKETEFKQEPPWEEEPEWEQVSEFIHEPEWEDATEFEEKTDVEYEIVFLDEIEVKQEL